MTMTGRMNNSNGELPLPLPSPGVKLRSAATTPSSVGEVGLHWHRLSGCCRGGARRGVSGIQFTPNLGDGDIDDVGVWEMVERHGMEWNGSCSYSTQGNTAGICPIDRRNQPVNCYLHTGILAGERGGGEPYRRD